MKPLKDYVEIIFAVPAKHAEQSGTFVMVPGRKLQSGKGVSQGS